MPAKPVQETDSRARGRRVKGTQDPSVYRPSAGGRESVKVPRTQEQPGPSVRKTAGPKQSLPQYSFEMTVRAFLCSPSQVFVFTSQCAY